MSFIKRSTQVLLAIVGVILPLGLSTATAYADDTTNYPWIRPDRWLSQVISSPTGGIGQGHIGVDIKLGRVPNDIYNPCHNASDTYYQLCAIPGGYYKVHNYWLGGNDFPYGIFVDSKDDKTQISHNWAKRVGSVFMEIYPYSVAVPKGSDGYRLDPGACGCTVYGGYQVSVNDWNGGYSKNIGQIRVASFADRDVGKMNGYIKKNRVPVKAGEVNIDWFGMDRSTTRSSTGYPVYSFASWPTNKDGYYTSGPVLKGNYHIYVSQFDPNNKTLLKKVECVGINVKGQGDRIDMELTRQHFGLDGPGRQCYDR